MYNDDSNRSGQSQGPFVRRTIPKYNGDKSGSYQGQGQGSYNSGYNNNGYSGGDRQSGGQ